MYLIYREIDKLHNTKRANSVSTFNFSTQYSIIPNDKLKHATNEVINFCFKDEQGKWITITKYGASWVNNTIKHNILFD